MEKVPVVKHNTTATMFLYMHVKSFFLQYRKMQKLFARNMERIVNFLHDAASTFDMFFFVLFRDPK